MDNILIKPSEKGLSVGFRGKSYELIYPSEIWGRFPECQKRDFAREYGFVSTIMLPVIAGINELEYNTAEPFSKEAVKEIVRKQIPGISDDYGYDARRVIERFDRTGYLFNGEEGISEDFSGGEGEVIPLSCGKDSLLTLALAKELGLEFTAVYVDDTVSAQENKIKKLFTKRIAEENNVNIQVIENNIEKLNDFETWNKPQTCLGYSHMIVSFCLASLPFMHNNASTIILGNQQDMNFSFANKQGMRAYAAYEQTTEARHKQQGIMQAFNKDYKILSLIEPLANIAEVKILFSRYPELAKYEVSCDCLYGTREERWCHGCSKCARLGLLMLSQGFNPKTAGLNPLLEKKFQKYYVLFGMNQEIDRYEKTKEARDQQLLAFYMAYKRGVKGELIDLFKKRFLKEAVSREDELRKKFFRIYETDLPQNINSRLNSIFKEELRDLQ